MKDKELSAEYFLDKHHLNVSAYDFFENCEKFITEMENGLDGGSSLEMVPTFIEEESEIPVGVPVLVLDAGGTNFRAAIVTFSEDYQPEITRFRKMGMPGIERELTKEEFFSCIVDFIEELAPEAEKIGFCFSYAMDKTPDKDGRLIKFSKEVKAPEVEGELIGKGILETLRRRGINNITRIIMLNDTVATLLAGKAAGGVDAYDDYIGLIIGTGLNASYNESNRNIRKLPLLPSGGAQIINIESGSYSMAPFGSIDVELRNATANPESYHFEKMISGAYQGPLCLKVMKTAARGGLLSESFGNALTAVSAGKYGFTTSNLSSLLETACFQGDLGEAADIEDTEIALKLCRAVTDRAAFLSAVKLAGIITKTNRGRSADKPVCICADGSTFWKLTGFKDKIEDYLREYLEAKGQYFKFIEINNAPIIGAAVAGLTN
ncbi:MAG: hexokinase [Spirochaetales bacterium]|nr:hexokinase [Spirochaetales bacterium]